jgi:hypothetical protein
MSTPQEDCVATTDAWLSTQTAVLDAAAVDALATRIDWLMPKARHLNFQGDVIDAFARDFFTCTKTLQPQYEDAQLYRAMTPMEIAALPEWEKAYRRVYLRFDAMYAVLQSVYRVLYEEAAPSWLCYNGIVRA